MGYQAIERFTLGPLSNTFMFYVVLGCCLCTILLLRLFKYVHPDKREQGSRDQPKSKSGGVNPPWQPSSFRMPDPQPCPGWSLTDTKPLPYRPFRYGPKYFTTMGLRNLNLDEWIELDNDYPRFHGEKSRRILERGSRCCQTTPEAYAAANELLQELVQYLPARYPSLYQRTASGIKNLWSGEELTTTVPLSEDPMQLCGRLTQDDLAIMMPGPDGQYYLKAGAILLAGFWRLEDKLNMPLVEIHTSGNVPHYKEKLQVGMDNFFRRLKPGQLIARNNYVVQVGGDLPWAVQSVGSEDNTARGWHVAQQDPPIEQVHLRFERQTLHRLPQTGGIVFTIHTYLVPVIELAKEDYVPGRLASAIRSWTEDISNYKGKQKFEDVLLAYLDEQHQKQVDRGLDLTVEDERRSYPW